MVHARGVALDGTQGHLIRGPRGKLARLLVELCVAQNGTMFLLATECQLVGRLSPIAAKWRCREGFQLVQVNRAQMKRAHCWKATAESTFIVLEPAF